ncbi:MAG: glycosyltransferase, partial [Caulobacteraceae bacterium]
IAKGGGAPDGDSFLFVTKPSLLLGLEETPHQPLTADAESAVWRAVNAGQLIEMVWLPMPANVAKRGDLVVHLGAARLVARDLQTTPSAKAGSKESQTPAPLIVSSLKAALAFNRRHDADGRRAHALRLWLERAEAGEPIPDLEPMQAALSAGVTSTAPAVEFPSVETPAVSVILIPTGDAGADRLSQAALRFAVCRALFEVILAKPGKGGALAAINAAAEKARGEYLVFLSGGWEPVAGWLDELLAVFSNFNGVAMAGPKTIEHDGRLFSAGLRITPKGRIELLGRDGNPRDPAHGFVRAADAVFPAMVPGEAWRAAGGLDPLIADVTLALADLALRSQQLGGRVLYTPTAELWRLKDAPVAAEPSDEAATPFRMRWAPLAASSGWRAAYKPLRVLFVDQEAPTVDMDAGGYAAFQEIRLLQALGATVSFLPKNLAWMDRHTITLQRAGVECLYAPFVPNFEQYLRDHTDDYDAIFVLRYKVGRLVLDALGDAPRKTKLLLNVADLHFLREIREAAAGTPGFDEARARETQASELSVIAASDVTLTYSEVEAAIIESHTFGRSRIARAPWVVETRAGPIGSPAASPVMMFLGGFGHPPNASAIKAFVRDSLPAILQRQPNAKLIVVGSKAPPDILALASQHVEVRGYVADLDEVFSQATVFIAPLITGAGLKGKVIEALSRGVPTILSPIAAEGTGLINGADCLIAETPAEWAEAVEQLHSDPQLWRRVAEAGLKQCRKRFSFEAGLEHMRRALALAGIYSSNLPALHYRHALPDRSNGAASALAVLPTP